MNSFMSQMLREAMRGYTKVNWETLSWSSVHTCRMRSKWETRKPIWLRKELSPSDGKQEFGWYAEGRIEQERQKAAANVSA